MDEIRLLVKRGRWIAQLGMLLSLLVVISAQPGFLSISCGGKRNHTAENNITWVTDADYIDVGETGDIGDATEEAYGSYLQTLRFFPKPLNKSCYQLHVTPDVPYLLRLWFAVGNYTGFQKLPSFSFSIETLGMLHVLNVTTTNRDPFYFERILVSSGRALYICLIRTSEPDDPFLSAIELRTLQVGMYKQVKPGTICLPGYYNPGGNSAVRYPEDKFDRIWSENIYLDMQYLNYVRNIASQEAISTYNTEDLPPTAVMQTAWVINSDSLPVDLPSSIGYKPLLLFYFAEIQTLNMSELRSLYVEVYGETQSEIITLVRNYSAIELTLLPNQTGSFTFSNNNLWIILPLCVKISRSLDNNHLMGSLPNFSNLTMLERLYLQNNNFSGTVEWLSDLKNLKELNIENNNFSGVIPAQLLLNCSLKLNYSGNPYLVMNKRGCTLQISNNNKSKVVLGMTLSGILILALGLIVGIVLYRKKTGRNKEAVANQMSAMDQGCSMIMVPNPTKCRAFTLDEMVAATQNFNREIGRGGFGSVFFGKLPDENDIAVKVLSLFSHQGVHEFLNEVDLLSRINHRNLVSLLGYCNESREVMLIYEHMSGGSLRDHLYGAGAENSELNWKTRLKIALEAAQGLEYLHVGCTPKIIHRDIKTANILLDSNMNGKLADFGLSRMTNNEEATHVTTAVKGTIGYVDPEYHRTQMLTEKSDVYSFGVVLLEIICGRPPIDVNRPEHEQNIIRWVTLYLMDMDENGSIITEIIDQRLRGNYEMKSVIRVAKLAMRCVHVERSSRPNVSEVVAELKEAMKHEDKTCTSISELFGIESGELMAGQVETTKRRGMDWSDNSSNFPNAGR